MTEIWKVYHKGPKVTYIVSNLGRVKRNGELYTPGKNNSGYYRISCFGFVHQAVARLFLPNTENKPCIDHIDGNKLNNRVENLRWVTYSENMLNPITVEANKAGQKKHYELYGSPIKGKQKSEEHRKNISEARKQYYKEHPDARNGENNPMYGLYGKDNPNYGSKRTEEQRKNISKSLKGKHPSEETRKNMSESHKGDKNSMYGRTGEKHPMYGKQSPNKGKHRVYTPDGKYHYEKNQ